MENTKQYRLPKEFATKWLAALRSGEYKQGEGYLLNYEFDQYNKKCVPVDNDYQYCCLGVACKMSGIDNSMICGEEVIGYEFNTVIPNEIIGMPYNEDLIMMLTDMNDGRNRPKASFPEIADFIEQNCTLY